MLYMPSHKHSIKQSFNQLVSEKPSQLILGIIFIIYILLNVQTPFFLAGPLDTLFGKVLVVAVALVIFYKTNPVIGVLGLVVAYQIIKTASVTTGTYAMRHYLPSEQDKLKNMQSYNITPATSDIAPSSVSTIGNGVVVPGTLEEEMVERMVPLVVKGPSSPATFKAILDGQHGASAI